MVSCAFVPQKRLRKKKIGKSFITWYFFNLQPRRENLGTRFTIIRHARIVAWLFPSKLFVTLIKCFETTNSELLQLENLIYRKYGTDMVKGTFKGHFYLKGSHDLVGQFWATRRRQHISGCHGIMENSGPKQPETNDHI